MLTTTFGAALRRFRQAAGLSQRAPGESDMMSCLYDRGAV